MEEHGRSMSLKLLAGLVIGNLVWSAHPMMSKLLLADFSPAQAAWLRYVSALLAFGIAYAALSLARARRGWGVQFIFKPESRSDCFLGLLLGFMAFCYSPLLQMFGLQASHATDGALIIAMEPLITIFLAWILLHEVVTPFQGLSFVVALAGFALLAGFPGGGRGQGSQGWDAHALGNVAILVSLLGEASYSVIGRSLVRRYSPVGVFGFALVSGVVFLTLATLLADRIFGGSLPLDCFSRMSWRSGLALLWLGPMGTTASYLFWMLALQSAPLPSVALTLLIQPVCGALWGSLFLGERLGALQFAGGAAIVLAVSAQALIQSTRGPGAARQELGGPGLEVEKMRLPFRKKRFYTDLDT